MDLAWAKRLYTNSCLDHLLCMSMVKVEVVMMLDGRTPHNRRFADIRARAS